MNKTSQMLEKAIQAQLMSYAPYSKFHVGCCIRTVSDQYYVGCNIENASYSLTLCAETSAIAAMIAAGEKEIAEVVIVGSSEDPCSPCGACRQRIREFARMATKIHMFSNHGQQVSHSLAELLPYSFGPEHLLK